VVELLARKCASELSFHCGLAAAGSAEAADAQTEDPRGVCKNISYASFVMDLLGSLSAHVCLLCTATRREEQQSERAVLPADVVLALRAMFGLVERDNSELNLNIATSKSASLLRRAVQAAEGPTATATATATSPQKRRTKCQRVEGSPEGAYSIDIVGGDDMSKGNASASSNASAADVLDMLVEVTAAGLDMVTQRLPPGKAAGREGGTAESKEDCSSSSNSSINSSSSSRHALPSSTALPTAGCILRQCGVSGAALRSLGIHSDPRPAQQAVHAEFVYDHLLHVEYKQLCYQLGDSGGGSGGDREGYFASCMASDAVSLHLYQQIRSVDNPTLVVS
jgi:hypothetical protein